MVVVVVVVVCVVLIVVVVVVCVVVAVFCLLLAKAVLSKLFHSNLHCHDHSSKLVKVKLVVG